MTSKHAAKTIDPKDLSPSWKVLQMKLKEEKEEQQRAQEAEKAENPAADDGFTKVVSKKMRQRENRKRRAQEALATATETETKKVHHDIPVMIEDNEKGEPTKVMALDCEYVGGGMNGAHDVLARISLVNELGKIVYDKYVKPTEKVTDYRTAVSGIRPENLLKAIPFDRAQTEISKLLDGRIVVGHAVHNDFRVLKLNHVRKLTRDTAKCAVLRTMAKHEQGRVSLKKLAKEVLGIEIQKGEHDSITDARVALRLYEAVKKQWEAEIKRYRN
uniref:RNA exonuclease 4 n=1 Tax=Caenorhabditis japonica TaxID=281687 RepID=A0A8R1E263_CAEJA